VGTEIKGDPDPVAYSAPRTSLRWHRMKHGEDATVAAAVSTGDGQLPHFPIQVEDPLRGLLVLR